MQEEDLKRKSQIEKPLAVDVEADRQLKSSAKKKKAATPVTKQGKRSLVPGGRDKFMTAKPRMVNANVDDKVVEIKEEPPNLQKKVKRRSTNVTKWWSEIFAELVLSLLY